ncbi:MAG: type II toxin-antitoxin system RelE/ParE family toxin [Candidatus Hadarchaeota archaeon]
MMSSDVLLNPKAAREFKKLPHETAERIKENLKRLRENPTKAKSGMDVKYLVGTSDSKLYRLRVGGYRAIFWADERKGEVLVEKIAPRKSAYIGI